MNIIDFLSSLTNGFSFDGILLQFNNISIILISAYIGYKLRKDIYTAMLALVFYIFAKILIGLTPYGLLLIGLIYIIYLFFIKSPNSSINTSLDNLGNKVYNFVTKIINKIMLILFILGFVLILIILYKILGLYFVITILILFRYFYFKKVFYLIYFINKSIDNKIYLLDNTNSKIIELDYEINPLLLTINLSYSGNKLKPYKNIYKLFKLFKYLINNNFKVNVSYNINRYVFTINGEILKDGFARGYHNDSYFNFFDKELYIDIYNRDFSHWE